MRETIYNGKTWVDMNAEYRQAERMERRLLNGFWDDDLMEILRPALDRMVLHMGVRKNGDVLREYQQRFFEKVSAPRFEPDYLGLGEMMFAGNALALGMNLGALLVQNGIDIRTMKEEGLLNHPEVLEKITPWLDIMMS